MNDILEKLSEISAKQTVLMANQANTEKLQEKHSSILEEQGKTLLRNTITVEDHKKRSDNLEEEHKRIRADVDNIKITINQQMSNKQYVKDILTQTGIVAAGMSGAGGVIWGLYEMAKKLGL